MVPEQASRNAAPANLFNEPLRAMRMNLSPVSWQAGPENEE
jgi:hypothetical protein